MIHGILLVHRYMFGLNILDVCFLFFFFLVPVVESEYLMSCVSRFLVLK